MSARYSRSLLLSLALPLVFAVALAGLLFRSGSAADLARGRPALLTPVVLDRLVRPPQDPSSVTTTAAATAARGDGLKAW